MCCMKEQSRKVNWSRRLIEHFCIHYSKKLKPSKSTSGLRFMLMTQSVQSVTHLNRMFYNALLMICWFGAIPLSCTSSPQVQTCDSLMKRSWWKLWDNIIFGGLPLGALRLVHDPVKETWPRLCFTAVLLEYVPIHHCLLCVELGILVHLYETLSSGIASLPANCNYTQKSSELNI